MKILLAQINVKIGAIEENTKKIIDAIQHAQKQSAEIVLFPECALCGPNPGDLLLYKNFSSKIDDAISRIAKSSSGITTIVGTLPGKSAIIKNEKLLGIENFFEIDSIAIVTGKITNKKVLEKSEIVLNPTAVCYPFFEPIWDLGKMFISCNQIGGHTSHIYEGGSYVFDSNGTMLAKAKSFEEDFLLIDVDENKIPPKVVSAISPLQEPQARSCGDGVLTKFAPSNEGAGKIYAALTLGIKDYFIKSGFKKAILGLSGGLDSAVVACIATKALGNKNVLALSMPSEYTSKESKKNAVILAKNLNIELLEIEITEPFDCCLDLLSSHFKGKKPDVTEENMQARIRALILMSMANKHNMLLLNTSNKSEAAMGYASLYGDTCGALGILGDVTKTQIRELANFINKNGEIIPKHAIERPPSAELRHGQRDSDSLPEYELLDNVVNAYLNYYTGEEIAKSFDYELSLVKEIINRIEANQYKRFQFPPALQISSNPFFDHRTPILHSFKSAR